MRLIIIAAILFMAATLHGQTLPDSIYIQKDSTNNVLLMDASNDMIFWSMSPAKDVKWAGVYGVQILSADAYRPIVTIRPSQVTKTIVGTDTTTFSGTSRALALLLSRSFFKPN